MASLPGAAFNITGASGSQASLTPKSGWKAYVLPRGGNAAQDSTGTLITFDSASVAARFAVNNWIQVGLLTANIRKVGAVGGTSISVLGSAVTVTENDRVYLIGNTQPTVSGGSATYTIPQSIIRQRDDDAADLYTNSMVTSNSDGLIQFWAGPNFYDVLVQDGNQSLQGSIVDLPVGSVGGISTDSDATFGGSVTITGALGVTGWATFGSTVTMHAALGVTGWATFGSTVTMHAALGVTGGVAFGATLTVTGPLVGSSGTFSNTLTGTTITGTVIRGTSLVQGRRHQILGASTFIASNFTIGSGWGSTASVTSLYAGSNDQAGQVEIRANGATFASNPLFTMTFHDGAWPAGCVVRGVILCTDQFYLPYGTQMSFTSPTSASWIVGVTPTNNIVYHFEWNLWGISY